MSLDLCTWNVGNASNAKVLKDLLALLDQCDVLALQEVGDRGAVLHQVCVQTGARLVRFSGEGRSSGHVALLVTKGIKVTSSDITLISPKTYVGRLVAGSRKTGYAEPKYIVRATVRKAGDRKPYPVGVTHLVPSTSNPANGKARSLYRRQVDGCVRWMLTRKAGRPVVLCMDANAGPMRKLLAGLRKIAAYIAPRSHGRRRIDHMWLRNCAASNVRAVKTSSDHRAVLATITPA
ncbi:MAG: endonuclease/exonuclease/phosphatase family protein [Nocardioidaceae bacterium]|nr:MAG: endonuclease/exonuclease/phosphatase family protein [Nocardioidaceae bacterium]